VVEAPRASPITESVLIVNSAPVSSVALPWANSPSRILGPCRSASTATVRPGGASGRAHALDQRAMLVVTAVREVEARDVHAGVDQRAQRLGDALAGPSVHTMRARGRAVTARRTRPKVGTDVETASRERTTIRVVQTPPHDIPLNADLPRATDLVVVGAGIVGLATAWHLARKGIAVTVLEAEDRLAAHQTGRSSGSFTRGSTTSPAR
jgi:hypothetical protein